MWKEKLKKAFVAALIAFLGALGGFSLPDDAFGQPGNYIIPHDHSSRGKGGVAISPDSVTIDHGAGNVSEIVQDYIYFALPIGFPSIDNNLVMCSGCSISFGESSFPNSANISNNGAGSDLRINSGGGDLLLNRDFSYNGDIRFGNSMVGDTVDGTSTFEITDGAGTNRSTLSIDALNFAGDTTDSAEYALSGIEINRVAGGAATATMTADTLTIDNVIAGDQLTVTDMFADDITVNGVSVRGEKTALASSPESRDTTTAITNDNNISAGIGIQDGTWEYIGLLRFTSGSTAPDLTIEFNFGGSVGSFSNDFCYVKATEMAGDTVLYMDYLAMDELSADIQLPASNPVVVEFKCIFTISGGTANAYVAWGPQTSDANAVIRQALSYSVVRQLQ